MTTPRQKFAFVTLRLYLTSKGQQRSTLFVHGKSDLLQELATQLDHDSDHASSIQIDEGSNSTRYPTPGLLWLPDVLNALGSMGFDLVSSSAGVSRDTRDGEEQCEVYMMRRVIECFAEKQ